MASSSGVTLIQLFHLNQMIYQPLVTSYDRGLPNRTTKEAGYEAANKTLGKRFNLNTHSTVFMSVPNMTQEWAMISN